VPARPSGKGRFSEGKALGTGKGRMRSGAGSYVFVRNFLILISLGGRHLVKFGY
jgi:hypothetical protein